MKPNNTIVTASLKEAQQGKAFTNIDISSLPVFKESDYAATGQDYRKELIERLRNKVFTSLPAECLIENSYSGILATDLFTLNTLLGSMIENQVVHFLNSHRHLWDDGKWNEYNFIRSSESFPDVRLVKATESNNVILGIELKSWFILSKEGEPSFRYRTASEACDKGDLLCIIPWHLSDAVCGHPVLVSPWVFSAKAAAEATKRHWIYERQTEKPLTLKERDVEVPNGCKPYMLNARDKANYKPANDGGNNFGRLARTGIMTDFVEKTLQTDILGIPANNWRLFLKAHADSNSLSDIRRKINNLSKIAKSDEFDKLIKGLRDYLEGLPNI